MVLFGVGGCVVEGSPRGGGGGGGPPLDTPHPLGTAGVMGYRVAANASAVLPGNERGFVITADGAGGYRVAWSDLPGSHSLFSGTITTDGTFDAAQLRGLSGAEDISLSNDGRSLAFSSAPGVNLDGVDLV
ncbi:MAG TPA: hypothetical protein VGL86_30515, partial [Polyangia bacterium]